MRSSSFKEPNCVFFGAVCGEGRSSARPRARNRAERSVQHSPRSRRRRRGGGAGPSAARRPWRSAATFRRPPLRRSDVASSESAAARCDDVTEAGRGSGGGKAVVGFAARSGVCGCCDSPVANPALQGHCSVLGDPCSPRPGSGPPVLPPPDPAALPRRAPTISLSGVNVSARVSRPPDPVSPLQSHPGTGGSDSEPGGRVTSSEHRAGAVMFLFIRSPQRRVPGSPLPSPCRVSPGVKRGHRNPRGHRSARGGRRSTEEPQLPPTFRQVMRLGS